MDPVREYPLRERKQARTRLRIAHITAELLNKSPFAELSVKSIADAAEISEATFFNYFARKQTLLAYIAELWTMEFDCRVYNSPDAHGRAKIEQIFQLAFQQIQQHPALFGEMLAHLATAAHREERPNLSRLDRLVAFPDEANIGEREILTVDRHLFAAIESAINVRDLPPNTHAQGLLIQLLTLFFGVPLMLIHKNPASIGQTYRYQLQIVWQGLINAANAKG